MYAIAQLSVRTAVWTIRDQNHLPIPLPTNPSPRIPIGKMSNANPLPSTQGHGTLSTGDQPGSPGHPDGDDTQQPQDPIPKSWLLAPGCGPQQGWELLPTAALPAPTATHTQPPLLPSRTEPQGKGGRSREHRGSSVPSSPASPNSKASRHPLI